MNYIVIIIMLILCIGCKKETPIDYRDAYTGAYTCQLYQFYYDYSNSSQFVYDSSNGIIQITKLDQDSMVDFYFGEGLRFESDKLITDDFLIKPIGKEIKASHHIPFKIEKNLKLSTLFYLSYLMNNKDSIHSETKTFNLYFDFAYFGWKRYRVSITGKKNKP